MSHRSKGSGSVFQLPDGSWRGSIEAGWTANGTRRRLTRRGATKREVLQKLKELQREISLSGIPQQGQVRGSSIKAYAETYLTRATDSLRPGALNATTSAIQKWIIPTVGHIRLDQVSPAHVESVGRAIIKAGLSGATARRYQQVLIVILKDAARNGANVSQSALMAKLPDLGTGKREDIPLDDAKKIVATALSRPDGARWLLALLAGVRPAEALGLTWPAVDFENGFLTISWQLKPLPCRIPRDPSSGFKMPLSYEVERLEGAYHLVRPKTRAGQRIIPLVAPVLTALAEWREVAPKSAHDLIFCTSKGSPLSDKADRKNWRSILEQASAGTHDLYSCRHTTATLLRAGGVDEETIISIMGHSSIRSTKSYLHTDSTRARSALDSVAARLIES